METKENVKIECSLTQHGEIKNHFSMEGTWEVVKEAYEKFLQTHERFVLAWKEVEIKTEELKSGIKKND